MNYTAKINSIIDNNLSLPKQLEDNKEIIKSRFVEEVSFYEKKRDHTKRYYNIFRFIVTIGSIFLPAILSLGQMDPAKLPKNFDQVTYWSSWSISLMVTISNGFLQLFSLDKNYFNYVLVVEQLKTEGWQFFGLSGKYEEYTKHDKKAYKEFCKAVENIKRKQIETEFAGKGNTTKKKEQKSDAEAPLLPDGGGGGDGGGNNPPRPPKKKEDIPGPGGNMKVTIKDVAGSDSESIADPDVGATPKTSKGDIAALDASLRGVTLNDSDKEGESIFSSP